MPRFSCLVLQVLNIVLLFRETQSFNFTGTNGCDGNGPAGGLGELKGAEFIPFDESRVGFLIDGQEVVAGTKIYLQTGREYIFSLETHYLYTFDTGLMRVTARRPYNDDTYMFGPRDPEDYDDGTATSLEAEACDNDANVWGIVGPGYRSVEGLFTTVASTGGGVILVDITVVFGTSTYAYTQFEVRITSKETSFIPPYEEFEFFAGDNGCDGNGPAGGLSEMTDAVFIPFDESRIAFVISEFAEPNTTILVERNVETLFLLYSFVDQLEMLDPYGSVAASGPPSFVTALIRVAPVNQSNSSEVVYTFHERMQQDSGDTQADAELLPACEAPVFGITEVEESYWYQYQDSGLTGITGSFMAESTAEFVVDVTVVLTHDTNASAVNRTQNATTPVITYTYNQYRLRSVSGPTPDSSLPPIDTSQPFPPSGQPTPSPVANIDEGSKCDICGHVDWVVTLPTKPVYIGGYTAISCGIVSDYIANPNYESHSCDEIMQQVTKRCGCKPMNKTAVVSTNVTSIVASDNVTSIAASTSVTSIVASTNATSVDKLDNLTVLVINESNSSSNGCATWKDWWSQGWQGLVLILSTAIVTAL